MDAISLSLGYEIDLGEQLVHAKEVVVLVKKNLNFYP